MNSHFHVLEWTGRDVRESDDDSIRYEGIPACVSEEDIPDAPPKHVIATFDIECLSSRSTWEHQIFPDAKVEGDVITQVCTFFSRMGESAPFAGKSTLSRGRRFTAHSRGARNTVGARKKSVRLEGPFLWAWSARTACARRVGRRGATLITNTTRSSTKKRRRVSPPTRATSGECSRRS